MIQNNMAFEERIRQMIAETKSIGYNPTYFIRMVQELGAVTACKQLINKLSCLTAQKVQKPYCNGVAFVV